MNSTFRKIIAYVLVFTMALTMNVNVFATTGVVTTEPTVAIDEGHDHEHAEDGTCLPDNSSADPTVVGEEDNGTDDSVAAPKGQPGNVNTEQTNPGNGTEESVNYNLTPRETPQGTWGDNVTWSFLDGILTIAGNGDISETYGGNDYPWGTYNDEIIKIVVEAGITGITPYNFEYCENVETIVLPETVTTISLHAFNDCGSLNNLIIPSSVTAITGTSNTGNPSFIRCESLTDVYYFGTEEEWNKVTNAKRIESANSNMTIHFLEKHESTETCTEPGQQAYYQYDDISVYANMYDMDKNVITELESVPAKGHSYGEWVVDKKPSYGVEGSHHATCSDCGDIKTESLTLDLVDSGSCGVSVTWKLYEDGNLFIMGTGSMASYASVEAPWSAYMDDIKAVVVKDGVTNIGSYSFYEYRNLEKVTLSNTVTSLDERAFDGCGSLVELKSSADIQIGEYALARTDVKSVTCGTLGAWALYDSAVEAVYVTGSTSMLAEGTFSNCNSLKYISLPSSISTLKDACLYSVKEATVVFRGAAPTPATGSCEGLTGTIYYQDKYSSSWSGFLSKAGLSASDISLVPYCTINGEYENSEIVIEHSFGEWIIDSKPGYSTKGSCHTTCGVCGLVRTEKILIYGECGSSLTYYLHDSGILQIEGTGRMNNYYPDFNESWDGSTIRVESSAPWKSYVADIKTVILPEGITYIGDGALYNCTNLTGELKIPAGVTGIGRYAFAITGYTGDLVIPEGVTSIGDYAFEYCKGFDGNLYLPDSLTTIGNEAFYSCTALTGSVTIPRKVKSLSGYSFYNCTGLGEFVFLNKECTISENKLTVPEQATIVGYKGSTAKAYAEKYNRNFVELACLPEMHEWNEEYTVDVPATCTMPGVQSIRCALCEVTKEGSSLPIPALGHNFGDWIIDTDPTCESAGEGYRECSRCDVVQFGEIEPLEHTWAEDFTVDKVPTCAAEGEKSIHCTVCETGRTEITVIEKQAHEYGEWTVETSAEFGKAGVERQYCQNGCGAYDERQLTIVDSGMCGENLTWNVDVDGTLTVSGTGDMEDYTYSSVTTTGVAATAPWTKYGNDVKTLVLPEGLTYIGNYAFAYCSGLTGELMIPENVENIGTNAFMYTGFTGDLVIPQGVQNIKSEAFYACKGIVSVSLPESLVKIGQSAFYDCSGITESIIVPQNVTTISALAFFQCSSLSKLIVLNKDCAIGDFAETIYGDTIIVGYKDSTAEAYANKYGREFVIYSCLPDEHEWNENYTVDKPATCTTPGVQSIHCTVCNREKEGSSLPIVALGHDFGDWIIDSAPTCEDAGERHRDCSRCDEIQIGKIEPLGHTWEENFTVDKKPTCTVTGEKSIHCTVCDDGRKEITVVEKLPHEYGEWTKESESYRHRTCGVCNFLYEEHLVFKAATLSVETGNDANLAFSEYKLGDFGVSEIIYTSSNDSVASVKNGVVTAHRFGRVMITAKVGGVTTSCEVEVTDPNLVDAGYCGENLFWALTEDGALTIYGSGEMYDYYSGWHTDLQESITSAPWGEYRNSMKALTMEDGMTSIGAYAFLGCKYFTNKLNIPSTVKVIGASAFENCQAMTGNLVIPEGVTRIEDNTFSDCQSLDGNLVIPDSVQYIGSYAFKQCYELTGVLNLPENLTYIGDHAFYRCEKIKGDLVIPDSIQEINIYTFYGCKSLNGNLILPGAMTSIREHAFYGCSSLTGNLIIPESVTLIGEYAFGGCSGLIGELNLHENIDVLERYAFSGCSGFTGDLIIPDNFKSIAEGLFSGCAGFDGYLIIPDSVTKIGANAFNGCSGLKGKLNLPSGLTEIARDTFSGCAGFTGDLFIPDKVVKIDTDAFYNCAGFNGKLSLPDGITVIGSHSFANCGFTGELKLPSELTEIGAVAFYNCKGFTGNLIVPEKVSVIGGQAFYNCSGLNGRLTLPIGLKTIEYGAFGECVALTGELVLPDTITEIQEHAFESCRGFTGDLVLPEKLKTVEYCSFYNCAGIDGIVYVPQSVTAIENDAFSCCYNAEGFVLPDNILSIESYPFSSSTFWVYPESYADTYLKENYSSCTINYIVDEPYKPQQDDFFELKNMGISMNRNDVIDVVDLVVSNQEFSADELTVKIDNSNIAMMDVEVGELAALNTGQTNFSISYGDTTCYGTLTVYDETYDIIPTTLSFAIDALVLEKGTFGYNPIFMTPAEPGMESKLTWTTDDSAIATVDKNGIVTGVKAGETKITAKYNSSVYASFDVTVGTVLDSIVVPEKYSDLTLYKRDTAKLKYYTYPYDAYEKEVYFESNKPDVVTVSNDGVITAVGVGEAEIKIISAYSCIVTNTVKVTVINPLKGISFKNNTLSVENLNNAQLELLLDPYDAEDVGEVTYISNRPGMVGVDETGKVTVTGFGIATITAEVNGFTAQCKIIAPELPLTGINIEESSKTLTYGGDSSKLTASVTPYNTTDEYEVVWSSSDESVVAVDQNGVITPVGAGTAEVFVTTGTYKDSCTVTVNKAVPEFKYPEDLAGKVGTTLADIELPEGFEWEDETQEITQRGALSFKANYNPDPENYETIEGIEVSVRGVEPIVTGIELDKYRIETGCTGTVGLQIVKVSGQDVEYATLYVENSNKDVAEYKHARVVEIHGAGEAVVAIYADDVRVECVIVASHDIAIDEAEGATCTTDGKTEGQHCVVCGEVMIPQEVIPATGHTEVIDEAEAPTCMTDGLTEGKHCSVCNEILTAQVVDPALGHDIVYEDEIPATCTEDGYAAGGKCTRCDYTVESGVIPALGHAEVIDAAVEVTCTTDGKTEGKHCSRCNNVLIEQNVIAAPGHKTVTDVAVEETCTTDGLTEGSHCSACGEVFVAQEVIPATGHTEVIDEAVEVTCTTDGKTEGSHCSACNEVFVAQNTIPARGHKWGEKTLALAPTCTEQGYKEAICQNDNCWEADTEYLPALGHSYGEWIYITAPTCTVDDIKERYCANCSNKETDIKKAPGHKYDDGVVVKEPTATEMGSMVYTCQTCGATKNEPIPVVSSGKCGDNATWTYRDGIVTISGTGTITVPINQYVGYEAKKLIIEEGITGIARNAFFDTTIEGEVVIPNSVEFIESSAFIMASRIDYIIINNPNCVLGDYFEVDGAIIVGCEGSTAKAYAEKRGCEFMSVCDYYGVGHNLIVTDHAVPAACNKTGLTEGSHCAGCGEIIVKQVEIPTLAHDFNTEWTVATRADFGKAGEERQYCKHNCGMYNTREITIVDSGIAGKDVYWEIDINKTLTFSGTGPITDTMSYSKYGCMYTKVVIEEGITEIPEHAFGNQPQLLSVELADSIEVIGSNAFVISGSLAGELKLPANLKVIGDYAFYQTDFSGSVVLPAGVESVGAYAFADCRYLSGVQLNEGLKSIGASAFLNCFNFHIDTLVLPESLERCEDAFGMIVIDTLVVKNKECQLSFGGSVFANKIVGYGAYKGESTQSYELYQKVNGQPNAVTFEYICDYYGNAHQWDDGYIMVYPSCVDGGMTEYYCKVCNAKKTTVAGEATGHRLTTISAIDPTCTTEGWTEGVECWDCKMIIVPPEVIPATGHSYDKVSSVPDPAVTGGSIETYTCKDCGNSYCVTVPPETDGKCKHTVTVTVPGYDAWCDKTGLTEGVKCRDCGEFIVAQEIIPEIGHNYNEGVIMIPPTATTMGTITYTCVMCGHAYTEYIPPTGDTGECKHETHEVVPGYDATCIAYGLSDGIKCADCYYILVHQEAIDPYGHSWTEWEELNSDCDGTVSFRMCEACGEEESYFQEGEGHNYVTFTKVITRATLNAGGSMGVYEYCENCQDKSSAVRISTTKYSKIAPVKMSATALAYTGKSRIPTLTIKDATGKVLKKNVDYKVTIRNSKGAIVTAPKVVGKYKITIEFIGKYKGFVYKNYSITPVGTTLGKLTAGKGQITVRWIKKTATQVNGYQIRYSRKLDMSGYKTKLVSKAGTASLILTGLKGKSKYYIQIRTYKIVNGSKIYSAWSAKKNITTK